ncbi:hypothetical protein H9L13_10915 [Sphingomonas lutea]|uniref:Class I SAM-dependent methyltransferase n=1 Tax=Sphingomonas lutea TaxID=1045317 RepID=A0A7G9SH01_9SPHN|nr:hypothetical protein [Sphingomonas lutea]QNN67126.1 hypothetical protein H9L13_10915 [Sphingomonas lutea]
MRDLARFLYVQRVRGFDPPTDPHFDEDTQQFFKEALAKASLYLEYGSGGSTILADRLGVRTISVEGDRFYAKAVRSALRLNSSVRIIAPHMGITGEWSMPLFRAAQKGRRYVEAPFSCLNSACADLVLVDGRYRIACTLAAAKKASETGTVATIIVDDYRDRPQYSVLEKYLGVPKCVGRSAVFRVRPGLFIPRFTRLFSDPS